MTTPSGGPLTYSMVAGGGGVSVWLTTAEGWLGLAVGVLSVAILVLRLIHDWRRLRGRRRKGGGR